MTITETKSKSCDYRLNRYTLNRRGVPWSTSFLCHLL